MNTVNSVKIQQNTLSIDLLALTVADEENTNYRKLPEKVMRILMVKKKDSDEWRLPGDFVGFNEDLESFAIEQLHNEANTDDIYLEQLYTWGDVYREPYTSTVSLSYMALVNSEKINNSLTSNGEIRAWFTVSLRLKQEQKDIHEHSHTEKSLYQLTLYNNNTKLSAMLKINKTFQGNITKYRREIINSDGIAYDHARIIGYGIERIRNKVMYTDIAFSLMSELFTLTELQKVYEVILDTELLKANFRRKIANMVIETNRQRKSAGHRPSKLYKYNSKWHDSFG
ncbi:ADP-ribose pyrophosphatase [Clostridium sp. 'deep sea']|uniref:NUDIX hydrolase n=1 Tax=Clostridium sp. 'deep sea' TaxID=2779445 RepID=UPI001FABADFF|nr:ADP-ribose pyrophosphatase [Clostridium sp. 'deep sea']